MLLLYMGILLSGSESFAAGPPAARRSDHVDEIHGVRVPDPYRWLENDSEETRQWVLAQSEYARRFLDSLAGRDQIRQMLTKNFAYTRSAPYVVGNGNYAGIVKRGGRYFFLRQDGLQNQPVLYVQEAAGGAPRELINPNKLSTEGTAALAMWAASPDGKWVVYGVAKAGSDWQLWRVRDVATGKDLSDTLDWIKFSTATWSPDSRGFYYSRYPEPPPGQVLTAVNYHNKLYYHRLGEPQARDELIYERPDRKEWRFSTDVTSDGRYLIISVHEGTRSERFLLLRETGKAAPPYELTPAFDAKYDPIGDWNGQLYLVTDWKAPRSRVMAIDLSRPQRSAWREIVPQTADTLQQAVLSGGCIAVQYLRNAQTVIRLFGLDGKAIRDVALPGIGTANWALNEAGEPEQFYSFVSFSQPELLYRYDLKTGSSKVFFDSKLPWDPASIETKQVFYPSKDGTKIPMFLVHRRGLKFATPQPALLYGYGGFDISLQPAFSVFYLTWVQRGGVLAIANLRGGGEFGEAWHRAGMLKNKQNVFDDFIAAAEWLIAQGYTSKTKLAIYGASNGGLLVGACLNQRSDLFGAAIPAVGVMDMLRFHKFTIGHGWTVEYGSPDDPEMFPILYRYSPLHNIRPGQYPPTLVMTADHDDRVVPLHSFKYAAALQHAQQGQAPILLRVDMSAGHGAGKPTSKRIDEWTDMLAFLQNTIGRR
ncbi:MAG: prolyl oligopeptidase family serine peptidase [Bryobacteraceae bacterium]|nr:prolyl oligopeptidase family serine peptidase [Bryobacteraceae bacterium]MDW8378647.1 prolyl oligopeptidase family serine peptidase [Bryobacterales bacterium]